MNGLTFILSSCIVILTCFDFGIASGGQDCNDLALNPCRCYKEIDDEQRSTGFVLPEKSPHFKCDLGFRPFWYRFTSPAGSEIPLQPPKPNACGM